MHSVPKNRWWLFGGLAIGGCALDLATKSWIFKKLGMPGGQTWWLIDQIVGLQTSLNEGALFGMGQGFTWVFTILSMFAAAAIIYWLFFHGAATNLWLTIALGCVMAGILGNLYDRLGLWAQGLPPGMPRHAVRDWILLTYRGFVWPNFNIADSLLVCGSALFAWHAFRQPASVGHEALQHRGV